MGYNKNELFISGDLRKKKILKYGVIILVLTVIAISLFALQLKDNKDGIVKYDEESSLDYKVYLKDNEFFGDKYLEKDKQYIASLIDYIDTTFNYDLTLTNKDGDYDYSYRIEAEVDVKNPDNNNSLYKSSEMLVNTKKGVGHGKKTTNITEKLKIDYNKYNELISKFIETYDLSNLDSTLSINMYVDFYGNCGNLEKDNKNSVIKLVIPLTRKTVAIDMSSDVTNTTDSYINCGKGNSVIFLVLALLACGIDICLIVELVRYFETSKSPLDVYNTKLKKILNYYGSFIQKINNDYDMSKSQILKVDSFDDMLEIRDTLQAPILMLENKDKYGVFFIIPTAYNVLYTYALRVDDIKVDMINDVIDNHEVKNKKRDIEYNNEYITKQLNMINDNPLRKENIIDGTQDSSEDLYSQIEKTQEFRLNLSDEDINELFKELENTDVADVKKKTKKKSTTKEKVVKEEPVKKVEVKKVEPKEEKTSKTKAKEATKEETKTVAKAKTTTKAKTSSKAKKEKEPVAEEKTKSTRKKRRSKKTK